MGDASLSTALPIVWRESATAEEYERARSGRVFNRRLPDRYPIAIVEAENEEHVVQAVHLATQLKCRVSVRSGGHSWAVWSVRDEAVLIDLGHMKHVELDEREMVVSVSPSTTGSVLNDYLAKRNVMFCGGHCPDVGLGGFLLQGGMGWNCRVSLARKLVRLRLNR
jgi:FAD/FMN-containing dehydrogenase